MVSNSNNGWEWKVSSESPWSKFLFWLKLGVSGLAPRRLLIPSVPHTPCDFPNLIHTPSHFH